MKLAIGDVVRDRSDNMLCTVGGVSNASDGVHVLLGVSGGGVRVAGPYDLVLVAKATAPETGPRGLLALVVLIFAVFACAFSVLSAQELGAGWLLMFTAGLGAFTAVTTAHQWLLRLTGPRRFRV